MSNHPLVQKKDARLLFIIGAFLLVLSCPLVLVLLLLGYMQLFWIAPFILVIVGYLLVVSGVLWRQSLNLLRDNTPKGN